MEPVAVFGTDNAMMYCGQTGEWEKLRLVAGEIAADIFGIVGCQPVADEAALPVVTLSLLVDDKLTFRSDEMRNNVTFTWNVPGVAPDGSTFCLHFPRLLDFMKFVRVIANAKCVDLERQERLEKALGTLHYQQFRPTYFPPTTASVSISAVPDGEPTSPVIVASPMIITTPLDEENTTALEPAIVSTRQAPRTSLDALASQALLTLGSQVTKTGGSASPPPTWIATATVATIAEGEVEGNAGSDESTTAEVVPVLRDVNATRYVGFRFFTQYILLMYVFTVEGLLIG
ncbi:hypothetical protein BN946_scf184881.g8 [Trametes cinnabarina]|uniref:Uncharacterized protein n=1 Tax=Pycnoporus cinnabarinus TaxID=5643 RepID=A0A060SYX6_PYCCI|nr:hypothetical protein BN946_scf184881.g8 [Trametes cinnabarina]